MDILKMLEQTGTIDQISSKYGISQDEIRSVVQNSMPEIQSAIKENTSTEQGYINFMGAIKDHETDDLEGMIQNVDNVDKGDGEKIMTHLFGSRKNDVNDRVSRNSNTSSNKSGLIIALLLPMILSMLGKSARSRNMFDENDQRGNTDVFGGQRQNGPFGGGQTRDRGPVGDIGDFGRPNNNYQQQNTQRQQPQQPRGQGGLMDIVGGMLGGGGGDFDIGSILGSLLRK